VILLAACVLYGLVLVGITRVVAGRLAWGFLDRTNERYSHLCCSRPDGGQWFGATLVGLFAAIVWPVTLVWVLVGRSSLRVGAEARAHAKARAARLRELEGPARGWSMSIERVYSGVTVFSTTTTRLERELRRGALGDVPTGHVDMRTAEGKRLKGRVMAEVIELRERGHSFAEIGAAVHVSPSTLSLWCVVAGRWDLVHRPPREGKPANGYCHGCGQKFDQADGRARRKKYCDSACSKVAQPFADGAAVARAERDERIARETQERAQRILGLRAEYRRRRAAGEHLPWHVLRERPALTVEQSAEIEHLAECQRVDGAREGVGRRPWLVSLDAREFGDDGPSLLEGLVDNSASSLIDALMKQNGDLGPRRPVKKHPWRVAATREPA